ncbi:MAG TPA: sulfotransferase [Stellaceae bacterium]|nr:sulfotransferase [Stellaceae bacterium]
MPPSTPTQVRSAKPLLARAAQLLRANRPAEAVAPLREAAELAPANALVHHDLGLAYLEVGRVPEAVAAMQRAVAVDPRYTDAHFRLGIALEKAGDFSAALLAYDRATELLPSLTEAWFRAGAIVYVMGYRDEAIGCFRRAAASGPKTRFGRLGAARALLIENRDAEAEKALRQTLALDPEAAMAHDLLGNLLAEQGRFDEAYDCFARVIAIAPALAGTYYELVRCRRFTPEDGDLIARMEAALDLPGLDMPQRHRLHLAIGKAADDLSDYRRAMEHFDTADTVRRRAAPFDPAGFDAGVDRLIERCTPALMARAEKLGAADATPILVLGLPRSGTTLVEQILSSHRDVAAAGELPFWPARGALWNRMAPDGADAPFIAQAASDYLGMLRSYGPTAARVTDKQPFNYLWAGLIHLAFPQATIIHCRREAIDAALSIHQTHFHPNMALPTGGPELVAYIRGYRRVTDHWRRVLPADRFVEVDYETLAAAPEPAIRRIIAACNLAWDESCLHPERNPRTVRTPSKWQTRQPIYRSSVARWKRYEPWLGPLRALVDGAGRPDG